MWRRGGSRACSDGGPKGGRGVAAAELRIRVAAVQHRERCSGGGKFWQPDDVVRNGEKMLVKAPDPSLI
jgi:hypothetical protein